MVTGDLPSSTKAPELDDRTAVEVLKRDQKRTGQDLSGGSAVTVEKVGTYISYLIMRGFMPRPNNKGHLELPVIELGADQLKVLNEQFGGRGGSK